MPIIKDEDDYDCHYECYALRNSLVEHSQRWNYFYGNCTLLGVGGDEKFGFKNI
jgi:hypothetical protein